LAKATSAFLSSSTRRTVFDDAKSASLFGKIGEPQRVYAEPKAFKMPTKIALGSQEININVTIKNRRG
jgi:hypothetical protein